MQCYLFSHVILYGLLILKELLLLPVSLIPLYHWFYCVFFVFISNNELYNSCQCVCDIFVEFSLFVFVYVCINVCDEHITRQQQQQQQQQQQHY